MIDFPPNPSDACDPYPISEKADRRVTLTVSTPKYVCSSGHRTYKIRDQTTAISTC